MRRIVLVFYILVAVGADACADPSPSPNHITSRIPRQAVQSSAIAKVGYSKRRHILEIEFVNGAVYRYFDIPLSVHRDPDVGGIKSALLRFQNQETLSFGFSSAATKARTVRKITRLRARLRRSSARLEAEKTSQKSSWLKRAGVSNSMK